MKRLFFFFAASICAVTSSCVKDSFIPKDNKPVNFQFRVNNLQSSIGEISTRANLVNHSNYLYYLLYDAKGDLVSNKSQQITDEGFGCINESVPSGNYTLLFKSSKAPVLFSLPTRLSSCFFTTQQVDDDNFYLKTPVELTKEGGAYTFKLDRISAVLELQLDEKVPDNIAYLQLRVNNEHNRLDVATGNKSSTSSLGSVSNLFKTKRLTFDSDEARIFPRLSTSVFNTTTPVSVVIEAYDIRDVRVLTYNYPNLQCQPNKKTALKGTLFKTSDNDFGVGVNPELAEEIIIEI